MTTVSGYETNQFSTVATYFQIDDGWKSLTGKGVSVAIIDSGIDANHPDLQGKIKAHLNKPEDAIRYLTIALDDGMKFTVGTTFQHDPDLLVLNSNTEYQKLLVRNRQQIGGSKK